MKNSHIAVITNEVSSYGRTTQKQGGASLLLTAFATPACVQENQKQPNDQQTIRHTHI